MYRISVSTTFDAAHRLENYQGPCSRLHGHTFTVISEWECNNLDRRGITLDMVELKKHLRAVVVDMDHCFLNKLRELAKPTAENIAQLLFTRLSKRIPSGEYLVAVTVTETPGCSVRYTTTKHSAASGPETELKPADETGLSDVTEEGTNDIALQYNDQLHTRNAPPGPPPPAPRL